MQLIIYTREGTKIGEEEDAVIIKIKEKQHKIDITKKQLDVFLNSLSYEEEIKKTGKIKANTLFEIFEAYEEDLKAEREYLKLHKKNKERIEEINEELKELRKLRKLFIPYKDETLYLKSLKGDGAGAYDGNGHSDFKKMEGRSNEQRRYEDSKQTNKDNRNPRERLQTTKKKTKRKTKRGR